MPAYNYDNTLLGQYIRQIENPDSIGFNPQNRRWYAPPERGYDINNRGMGVDIVYNPEAANIVQGRDGKWLSEQEERDLRNRQLEYDLDILKKNTPAPLLANTYSPEGKAMAIGLLYRGDRKNLLIKDTPLKRAYYSGDENKFTQEVQRYYNKSTLKERRKQNDAFMKMKQQQKVKKSPSLLKIVKNRQASLDNWSNKWRKFEDGGYLNDSQQTPWDMLSMEQKSEFIKEAVKHGLRSMQEIKDAYNQLAMQQDSDEMQQQDYAQQQDNGQYSQQEESIQPQEEAQQDSYYQPQQEEDQDDEDPYGAEYDKMMYALGGNLFAGGGAQNRARPLFMRNGQIYKWRGVSNGMRNHIVQWEGPSMYRPTKDTITGKIVPKNVSIEKMEQAFFNAIPDDLKAFVFNNPDYADALFSYGYNVGMGAMRSRVIPTMRNYLKGKASARELVNTMKAQYDNRLRGLALRREYEQSLAYAALTGEISPLLKEESKKWDSNMNQVNQIINNPQGPGIIANPDFQPYNPEVFKKVMLGDQSDTPDTFTYSDLQAMREQQKEDAAAANAAKEEFAKEIWGDENTEKLEGLKALQTLQYFPEEQPDQAQIIQKPLTLEKRNPYSVNVGAYGGNLFLLGGLEDTEDSPEENTEEEIDTSTAPASAVSRQYTYSKSDPEVVKRYVTLLNHNIPQQAAFDASHMSIQEMGTKKYYAFGKKRDNLKAWGKAASDSLTTGKYKDVRNATDFEDYKRRARKVGYNDRPSFWTRDLPRGREVDKRRVNIYNQAHGLSPVVYNSYMPDDTFSPVQSDEGNITAYGGLLNNPNLFGDGGLTDGRDFLYNTNKPFHVNEDGSVVTEDYPNLKDATVVLNEFPVVAPKLSGDHTTKDAYLKKAYDNYVNQGYDTTTATILSQEDAEKFDKKIQQQYINQSEILTDPNTGKHIIRGVPLESVYPEFDIITLGQGLPIKNKAKGIGKESQQLVKYIFGKAEGGGDDLISSYNPFNQTSSAPQHTSTWKMPLNIKEDAKNRMLTFITSPDYERRLAEAGAEGADMRPFIINRMSQKDNYPAFFTTADIKNNPNVLGVSVTTPKIGDTLQRGITLRSDLSPRGIDSVLDHEVAHWTTYNMNPDKMSNQERNMIASWNPKPKDDFRIVDKAMKYNSEISPKMNDIELAKRLNKTKIDEFTDWKKSMEEYLQYLNDDQEIRSRAYEIWQNARAEGLNTDQYVDKYIINGQIENAPQQLMDLSYIYSPKNLKNYLNKFLSVSMPLTGGAVMLKRQQ